MTIDILSKTTLLVAVTGGLSRTSDLRLLSGALLLGILLALFSRCNKSVMLIAVVAPVIPIMVSHFGLEPLLGQFLIDRAVAMRALAAWLRIASMTTLSLAWFSTMTLREGAQLASSVGGGQFVLVPFIVAGSYLRSTLERWVAIREVRSLSGRGPLRKRKNIPLFETPSVGMQLTLVSLLGASELALACSGRGIGHRRALAIASPKPFFFLILIFLVISIPTTVL